jgi:hypothetical protein
MSMWAKLGGIALGIGGFATGNPALIMAGAGLYGAGVQTEGNDKAVKQQVAASEKAQGQTDAIYGQARGEMRDVYNQGQAGFAPYTALGHASLGNLGSMVGLKPVAAPAQAPQSQPYAPQSLGSLAQPPGSGRPVVDPEGLRPQQMAMANASGYGKNPDRGEAMAGRGLVRVEAPDGEQRWMRRAEADQFVSAGARILG